MYPIAYSSAVPVTDGVRSTPLTAGLGSGAAWLVASTVAYSVCQWATIAALAKIASPASLGHFGLAVAIATPIVMVTGVGSRALQATDALHRYAFADYFNLRLGSNVVAATIIAMIAVTIVDADTAAVLIPLAVAKIAEATSETCYGLAQRHHRMRLVALSKAARGALGVVALVAIVAHGGTMLAAVWALALTWTAFLVVVDLAAATALEPAFALPRWSRLWTLARESAPLGAVNGAAALTNGVPRYVLQWVHGATAVGYFTALASLAPALAQLATSVGHAAAPRLGWAAASNPDRFRALVGRLCGAAAVLGVVLVVAAVIAGRPFIAFVFTPEYARHHLALVLIVGAASLWVVNEVAYFALVAARRLTLQLGIQAASFVITAAAAVVLTSRFGINGAAGALVVGAAAKAALNAHAVLRRGCVR